MKPALKMNRYNWLVIGITALVSISPAGTKERLWEKKEVDLRAGGDRRIKAIYTPEDAPLGAGVFPRKPQKAISSPASASAYVHTKSFSTYSSEPPKAEKSSVNEIQIEAPPVAGFVPYIAVAVTDKWAGDDLDWAATPEFRLRGRFLTDQPELDYGIGLFDTGASTHIVNYHDAQLTGIYAADLITTAVTELQGANASAFGRVSYPLAIFLDGLGAIDPNNLNLDHGAVVGQSNVSILVGEEPPPGQPDLPTVVGTPMSVYVAAVIKNDRPVRILRNGSEYFGPDILFYDVDDNEIPTYENSIPLNLLPAGGVNVQYIIDYEAIFDLEFRPGTPSVIIGNLAQSLFFVNSLDLFSGDQSALDKSRFMVDTGAQVTVIGTGIASRLALNPSEPDFAVDIQDVTGQVTVYPGFIIDTLVIPALGKRLRFSQVPVVMLDVASPEGGYLDGIVGMNLFTQFNLVFRGGGLLGQSPPSLEFMQIAPPLVGDMAPGVGDGKVDYMDLAEWAGAWLATPTSSNWRVRADISPTQLPDEIVDLQDFAAFALQWRESRDEEPDLEAE